MSESGSPCLPKSTAAAVYPGIFSSVSLPADVKPGRYCGIRVQIAGAHGRALKVKSITLEGRRLFDGRSMLPFRNTKGLSVRADRAGGFAVLEILSDSASFDLDCGFSVRGAPPAQSLPQWFCRHDTPPLRHRGRGPPGEARRGESEGGSRDRGEAQHLRNHLVPPPFRHLCRGAALPQQCAYCLRRELGFS